MASNPVQQNSQVIDAIFAEHGDRLQWAYVVAADLKKIQVPLTIPQTWILFKGPLRLEVRESVAVPPYLLKSPFHAGAAFFQQRFIPICMRTRGGDMVRAGAQAARWLPKRNDMFPSITHDGVFMRCAKTVAAIGGVESTYGRILKYYPAGMSAERRVMLEPVFVKEVLDAMELQGLPTREQCALLTRKDIQGTDRSVKINPHSSNGAPTLGKATDVEPLKMQLGIAVSYRKKLEEYILAHGPDRVQTFIEALERSQPHDFLVMGKAKYDHYTVEKVMEKMLRFYTCHPRWAAVLQQQASQVFEEACKPFPASRSTQGYNFTGGGAHLFVTQFATFLEAEKQSLNEHGVGFFYVNCGDDTKTGAIWREEGETEWRTAIWGLDASSFDLTQERGITEPIKQEFRECIRGIDQVSAELWYKFQTSRLTLMNGRAVVVMKDAGPSGGALQSKVNGVLMGVALARLRKRIRKSDLASPEALEKLAISVGEELGLILRTEDLVFGLKGETYLQILSRRAFLYVGYWFYTEDGKGRVFFDFTRQMAGLPYSNIPYVKKDQVLYNISLAQKISGVLQCAGYIPRSMEAIMAPLFSLGVNLLNTLHKEMQINDTVFDAMVGIDLGMHGTRTVGDLIRMVESPEAVRRAFDFPVPPKPPADPASGLPKYVPPILRVDGLYGPTTMDRFSRTGLALFPKPLKFVQTIYERGAKVRWVSSETGERDETGSFVDERDFTEQEMDDLDHGWMEDSFQTARRQGSDNGSESGEHQGRSMIQSRGQSRSSRFAQQTDD